jgi:hypothetical protein
VLNSARFTYISPAGRFKSGDGDQKDDRQVIDGGYFENYGARTAAEISAKITEAAAHLELPIVPIVVIVSNDADALRSGAEPFEGNRHRPPILEEAAVSCAQSDNAEADVSLLDPETARKRNKDQAQSSFTGELIAPFMGLYATRGAHGQDALHTLRRAHCADPSLPRLFHLAVPLPKLGIEAAPMNWVLNPIVARFLLDTVPELWFNHKQAEGFAATLSAVQQTPAKESAPVPIPPSMDQPGATACREASGSAVR